MRLVRTVCAARTCCRYKFERLAPGQICATKRSTSTTSERLSRPPVSEPVKIDNKDEPSFIANSVSRNMTERSLMVRRVPQSVLPDDIRRLTERHVTGPCSITSIYRVYDAFFCAADRVIITFDSRSSAIKWMSGFKYLNVAASTFSCSAATPDDIKMLTNSLKLVTSNERGKTVWLGGFPTHLSLFELHEAIRHLIVLARDAPQRQISRLPGNDILPKSAWLIRCIDEAEAWRALFKLNGSMWKPDEFYEDYTVKARIIH